jgi:hypothetical protein
MKGSHGADGIDARDENVHRLRYFVDSKRFSKTSLGEMRPLRKSSDPIGVSYGEPDK